MNVLEQLVSLKSAVTRDEHRQILLELLEAMLNPAEVDCTAIVQKGQTTFHRWAYNYLHCVVSQIFPTLPTPYELSPQDVTEIKAYGWEFLVINQPTFAPCVKAFEVKERYTTHVVALHEADEGFILTSWEPCPTPYRYQPVTAGKLVLNVYSTYNVNTHEFASFDGQSVRFDDDRASGLWVGNQLYPVTPEQYQTLAIQEGPEAFAKSLNRLIYELKEG